MGFTPEQVDRMGLWEFAACMDGYVRAHGGAPEKSGDGMSEDRLRDLGIEGII